MRLLTTSFWSPRTTAAVLFFILCCLLSTVRLILRAPNPAHLNVDDICSRSDERFAALKSVLPSRGVVGYIGDPGNSGVADYYLAQYALAPLVIDRSKNHPLVIMNVSTVPPKPDTRGLEPVRNFGSGLVLFSNKDAR
jgi:hypothetical protein